MNDWANDSFVSCQTFAYSETPERVFVIAELEEYAVGVCSRAGWERVEPRYQKKEGGR